MPFGAVKGGQSHENNQYWNSCPCRRWKDDLDGEPAICQRSHFRTGERRKRDNEDGHHVFWSGSVGLPFKRQSLPSSGTDVKLTLWIRPATWIFWRRCTALWLVLDGAILVISAKDGVQAQTRILFHALRKMNIPTVIFSTRSTRLALICRAWFSLFGISSPPIYHQADGVAVPGNSPGGNTDIEAWMRSSKITMNYWKSISQENQSAGKNLRGRNSSGFKTPPCSQSIMAAPKMALAFNR